MVSLPPGYPTDALEAFNLLKARKRLSQQDVAVLAMIESSGEAFYMAAARAIKNDAARALLARNAQEERGHAHRLVKALGLLGAPPFSLPADSDNPFVRTVPEELPVDSAFLAMLESAERDGDLQYQAWADAEANPEVARLYRQNGIEETRHGERVKQVKQLLGLTPA
jgi:rubrerythrin